MNNPIYVWLMDDRTGKAIKLIDIIDVAYHNTNNIVEILAAHSQIIGGKCLHTRDKRWTLELIKELKNSTP